MAEMKIFRGRIRNYVISFFLFHLIWTSIGEREMKDGTTLTLKGLKCLRIIVSVAAYWTPGRNLEYLLRLLREYDSYPSNMYCIHTRVDTNSNELANILSNHAPPRHSTREVRVWSLEELGGDPEYLPHKHRRYWEDREEDFDFFIFTEDDILFTREAFEGYVRKRQYLQSKGWIFGWIRVETWGADNKT